MNHIFTQSKRRILSKKGPNDVKHEGEVFVVGTVVILPNSEQWRGKLKMINVPLEFLSDITFRLLLQ